MEKDCIRILMFTPKGKRIKSFNIKFSQIRLAFFTLIGLIMVFLSSFMLTYEFYKKADKRKEAVNKLTSQIDTLNRDLSKNETVKEKLEERLGDIEKRLLEMQELLDKKGIKKELSIGGEFIPADQVNLSHIDFVEKNINELFDVMKSLPVGTPLSGEINSGFGYRKDPFNFKLAFHPGVDIDAKFGQPIVATADGVVEHAGWYKTYGEAVIIDHKDDYQTLYGHLSKIRVKEGQSVKAGDIIGYAGSTGRSTGPHLHYEVIKDGKTVDPANYLFLR
jgi:murein DD-endopeptidase MepM/ murein hydrolase activator NlpD